MTYYGDMLEKGDDFQKHVAEVCWGVLAISLDFTGKENQLLIGETLQGIEVKFDDKYAKTGNLWIETAEKTSPELRNYSPSGIFRSDNTWLYIIGDYTTLFVFGKKTLQRLCEDFDIIENNRRTSRGFLLPDGIARRFAEKVI